MKLHRSLILAALFAAPAIGQATQPTPAYMTVVNSDGSERGRIFGLTAADLAWFDARRAPATRPTTGPTTKPTDPPAVVLPTIARNKASELAGVTRGNGFTANAGLRSASISIADASYEGYSQNIVIEGFAGATTLTNVRSLFAFRDLPSQQFAGNGIYLNQCGPAVIRGCFFGWNGYQTGKGQSVVNRNGYRHGVYQNVDAKPMLIEDTIVVGNSAAGIQSRAGATIRRCVILDSAINILAVRGEVLVEDCIILGGHRYISADGKGVPQSASGNGGIYAYTHVTLKNTWLVGTVGQDAPTTDAGSIKSYNVGAFGIGHGHRDNPKGTGSYTIAGDVRVIGWPAASAGMGTASPAGVTYGGNPIDYDPSPVLNAALANVISIPEARAKIAADVKAAVTR